MIFLFILFIQQLVFIRKTDLTAQNKCIGD